MGNIVCSLIEIYIIVLFVRIILSWFQSSIRPGTPLGTIASISHQLTEPVLAPVRNLMPRTGMFDFSPLIVFIGLEILQGVLRCPTLF